ncbi:hypothetical protein ACPZ19_48375 [Amycolatopsis lurida]
MRIQTPGGVRRRCAIGTATVLVAAVTGCGGPPTTEQPPGASPPRVTTPVPTEAPPSGETGDVRVTGTVEAGVEPGCLLLETGTTRYLLIGGDRSRLEPGQRMTITGSTQPGAPTTCMEGIPLTVDEISPAA